MRKYIGILLVLLFSAVVNAEIQQIPNQTLVSTSIGSMHTIDSFLVSVSSGGVSVFVYDDTLNQYRFLNREYIAAIDSVTSKLEDSILVINSLDEKLHFISLKNLPEISYLGFVDLHRNFADFALIGNSLYISGFYDGILRYTLQDYSSAEFIDSSMTGILVTQLSHDDKYLYALDEYNGLLRYELNNQGFGTFIDYLFVPLRSFAFTKVDSLFYLHLITGGFLVGDFSLPSGDNIIDSLPDLNQTEYLYYSDSLLIFTDSRELTLINRFDFSDIAVYPLTNLKPLGLMNPFGTNTSLMLPVVGGGLSFVSFDTTLIISDGLVFNGTINDMVIDNSHLYLSSSTDPINTFTIDSTGFTSFDNKLYESLKNTGQVEHNGDSLFVIYPDLDKLTVIVHADEPDSAFLENSITLSPFIPREMYYTGEQLYDNALIFIEYPFSYDVYTVSDSGYISFEKNWKFAIDVTSLSFKDSIAVVTNRKNKCDVYQIFHNFDKSRSTLRSFNLGGTASETIFYNDLLYLFEGHNMYIIDFSNINNIFIDTVLTIPSDVLDAVITEDFMFTVGDEGITKYDLRGVLPEVVETGGLLGNSIAVDSNLIVIHDNQTVMLYYHEFALTGQYDVKNENDYTASLGQNYPNPFNIETVISYSLTQKTEVRISVYNIIGQKVKTLIHTVQDAGNHTVKWDGTSVSGNVVASGIYLYKLETANEAVTKKMILLK